ncbi:dihydroxyacetone kinase subunit DhaK [Oscillospiraceae bacterium PP1C4]
MFEIFNQKTTAFKELISGILSAQPDDFVEIENLYSYTLHKKRIMDDRVQIVISGGGGYGALFPGFVGEGLADAVCQGDFDCAPNAYALYEVAKAVHRKKGILFLANHFTGDFLNNDMAQELLEGDNICSKACYVSDDLFSSRGEPKEKRGGLCGIALLIKIAASAADRGLGLEEVYRIVQKANDRLRSVTVCLNQQKRQMEFGPGFSGEAPAVVMSYQSADDLVQNALVFLLSELEEYPDSPLYFTINRMAGMSYLEGYIILQSVKSQLEASGHVVNGCSVGSYFNAFDSNGCIISVLAADDEIAQYIRPVSGYDFTI